MAKNKKITVKFYLVESKQESNKYNTYCQATYDRNTTKFPINYGFSLGSLENAEKHLELSLLRHTERHHDLGFRKALIEEIIRYEINKENNDYSIKGFGEKYAKYRSTLILHLNHDLFKQFTIKLEDVLTYRQYIDFHNRIWDGKLFSTYFSIFHHFNYLHENYNIDLKKTFGNSLYHDITLVGYFAAFDLWLSDVKPEGYIAYDRIPFQTGKIEVGEWLSNFRNVKSKFQDFYNSKDIVKILDSYSAGAYLKTAQNFGFDTHLIEFYRLTFHIDRILEDYLSRM